jgi:hypothetical protein
MSTHGLVLPRTKDVVTTDTYDTFPDFFGRCWKREWWPGTELNRRHKDFQSSALPTELPGRCAESFAAYNPVLQSVAFYLVRQDGPSIAECCEYAVVLDDAIKRNPAEAGFRLVR